MRIVLLLVTLFFSTAAFSQKTETETTKTQVVEAACGTCQFHMEHKGCVLAVRIDGKSYFVDGSSIRDHGNMHAADGMCTVVRKAEVEGSLVDDRFKVTSFKLLPMEEKKVKVLKKVKG